MKTMKIEQAVIAALILFAPSVLLAGFHEQGRSYFTYKKYDKAREMFLKDIEARKYGDSYYFLGEIEKMEGNYKEAEEYFAEAIKTNTTHKYLRNAHWNLIVLAEQKGDYSEVVKRSKAMWNALHDEGAKTKIENMINKIQWTDSEEAKEQYKLGIKLRDDGKTDEAIDAFKKALSISSDFLAPKSEIGIIYYRKGKFSEAYSYLSDVAEKIPFYAEVHMMLADIDFRNKNYSRAANHYDKAIDYGFVDKETEYNLYLNRGTCRYNLRQYENARDDIMKAVKIKGNSTGSLTLLAAIQIMLSEYDDAIKTLQQADKTSPDSHVIIFQLGSVYYKVKNDAYLRYFEKLHSLAAGDEKLMERYSKAFVLLAEGYFEKKRYDEGLRIFENLPKNATGNELKIVAARAYYKQENYSPAISVFESAYISSKDDRYMLCSAYARSGKIDKARDILSGLISDEEILKKARADSHLSKIAAELEESRNKRESSQAPSSSK